MTELVFETLASAGMSFRVGRLCCGGLWEDFADQEARSGTKVRGGMPIIDSAGSYALFTGGGPCLPGLR